ncbi:MAG: M15 family metallopeptidase [Patescibacteria group bacterium]
MGKYLGIGLLIIGLLLMVIIAPIALAAALLGGGGDDDCVAEAAAPGDGPVYFVGDSIGTGIRDKLGDRYTVNAETGRALPAGISALESDTPKVENADAVVVELGTNKSNGFAADAQTMVNKIRNKNDSAAIYWVEIFSRGDYANENQAIRGLGDVTVIQTKGKGIDMADNIHPNAAGYERLAQIVRSAVNTGAPADAGEDCPEDSGPAGECTANGIAFGLPGSNVGDREKVFGKANSAAAKQPVSFFGHDIQAHRKVVPCLEAVEREIKQKGLDNYKVRSIGGYHPRPGDPLYYFHMYGAAVDINPDTNPYCKCDTHDIPDSWVRIFEKYGFFWGGNFRTTKDWMHFEWHGEAP